MTSRFVIPTPDAVTVDPEDSTRNRATYQVTLPTGLVAKLLDTGGRATSTVLREVGIEVGHSLRYLSEQQQAQPNQLQHRYMPADSEGVSRPADDSSKDARAATRAVPPDSTICPKDGTAVIMVSGTVNQSFSIPMETSAVVQQFINLVPIWLGFYPQSLQISYGLNLISSGGLGGAPDVRTLDSVGRTNKMRTTLWT